MIEGLPSAQTILSELGEDATIWMVANEDKKTILSVPDKDNPKGVLWMFLSEKDCEHFAYILTKLNPQFKDVHLAPKSTTVGVILEYAVEMQHQTALIPPNKAEEFFKEYEEFLPHYYGI